MRSLRCVMDHRVDNFTTNNSAIADQFVNCLFSWNFAKVISAVQVDAVAAHQSCVLAPLILLLPINLNENFYIKAIRLAVGILHHSPKTQLLRHKCHVLLVSMTRRFVLTCDQFVQFAPNGCGSSGVYERVDQTHMFERF